MTCHCLRLAVCLLALVALVVTAPAAARAAGPSDSETLLPEPAEMARIEAAVDKGLEYLRSIQQPDGSFPSGGNYNGVNAMCLLAFLGRGHEPGRGPYQDVVDRAIAHILSRQRANDGYLGGSMYDHALATLALTEAYGFIPTVEMRRKVQLAIDLIVKSQSPVGGWRYNPVPSDADLSVTVMQVMALRSAQNARLNVPQQTIDNAVKYVRACAAPSGGFCYTPGGSPNMAQSAAGSLSLQMLGKWDDPTVQAALEFLKRGSNDDAQAYWFYANYYAMQSHFQYGGDYWAQWHPKVRRQLLGMQMPDGSFPAKQEQAHNGPHRAYSTAFGVMCLTVYLHYLPAYQR